MMKEHRYGLAIVFGLPLLGVVLAALIVSVVRCPGAPRDAAPAQAPAPEREQRAR